MRMAMAPSNANAHDRVGGTGTFANNPLHATRAALRAPTKRLSNLIRIARELIVMPKIAIVKFDTGGE